jgi:serine protease AprX
MPLVFTLALLVPGASGLTTTASASGLLDSLLHIHPYLQTQAANNPGGSARVIVQKTSSQYDSLAIARGIGSTVVEEFPLIQSLTLDVPLSQLTALSKLPGVKYLTIDGPVNPHAIDETKLATTYESAVSIPSVWNGTAGTRAATGAGIGVAVLDTGVNTSLVDFATSSNLIAVNLNQNATGVGDGYGHGTHVVGTIKGRDPQGRYIGVAPDATVVSVKISDDSGFTTESDLIRGMQWVLANKDRYNLRAVNVSLSTAIPTSYLVSPVALAAEALWRGGIIVVASAGNSGSAQDATWAVPGSDPYVLTVGALDHNQTVAAGDDSLASFSSRGKTQDGIYKPDILAPGRRIIAPLAGPNVTLARDLPTHVVETTYIRLSGTSMAAPVTAGSIALLLQAYPSLTPDQVKWLLVNTERTYTGQPDSAGAIDLVAAFKRAAQGGVPSANQNLTPSGTLLTTVTNLLGNLVGTVVSIVIDPQYWDAGYWTGAHWDGGHWTGAHWDGGHWDGGHWDGGHWDGGHWDGGHWDGGHWDSSPRD